MSRNNKEIINQSYQRNLIRSSIGSSVGINNHDRLISVYGKNADQIELLNKLQKQSKFTIWWYIVFFLLGVACIVLNYNGWIYVLDLYVVMVNIDLIARGKVAGIYVGIAECLLYSYIAFSSSLYSEVFKMFVISIPLNIVSIINWTRSKRKNKKDKYQDNDQDVVVKKLTKKQILAYIGIAIIVFGLVFLLTKYVLKQTTAVIIGSISLTNTIMMKVLNAKGYMQSWILSIVGDLIGIALWGQTLIVSGLDTSQISMIVLYVACFTNDIVAYKLWKGMYRKTTVNGGVLLAMRDIKITKIARLKRQFKNLRWDKQVDISKNS